MNSIKVSLFPLLISLALVLGCNDSKRDSKQQTPNIVGAWQLESIEGLPGFEGLSKSEPSKPFEKKEGDMGSLQQLEITDTHFYMIDSDGIHVSKFGLEYKVENGVIVTIDTESAEMTDYPIVGVTGNELRLSLKFVSEGPERGVLQQAQQGSNSINAVAVYKKIAQEKLATKTAQVVTFENRFSIVAELEGREQPVTHEFQKVGDTDFSRDGPVESLSCRYDSNSKSVQLSLTNGTVTNNDDGTVIVESTSPYVSIQFSADLAALGDGQHQLGEVETGLSGSFTHLEDAARFNSGILFHQDTEICDIQVDLKGAEMVLRADCTGSFRDIDYHVVIDSQCLMNTNGGW